ncbi:MAG: EF-hand domain-containing protein [Alphaproteobacteria bacterium]|nr:EF-hand domain-containing protein [Alphaproteobacteria bacterium]
MKTQIFLPAVIIGILATGAAYAASDDGDGNPRLNRFERLDEDGDGRIDRAEFANSGDVKFSSMDANGDGVMTMAELDEYERLQRITRRFKRMDADADGLVTGAEFAAARDKMFEHLDKDADGFLTTDDMKRRRHGGGKPGAAGN